jgi:hypothetical protein
VRSFCQRANLDSLVLNAGGTFVLAPSWDTPGMLDLLSPNILAWSVEKPADFVRALVDLQKDVMITSLDGFTSPPSLAQVCMKECANMIPTYGGLEVWDAWMRGLTRRHRRRIQEDYELAADYRLTASRDWYKDSRFPGMLEAQKEHLLRYNWQSQEPYGRQIRCLQWPLGIQVACETFPCEYLVAERDGQIAGVHITTTLRGRRYYLITLWNTAYRGVGMMLLAHSVKAAFLDPAVSWFDMMSGCSYKERYEPAPFYSYSMAVFAGEAPNEEVYPPYISRGRLFKLTECEVPYDALLP